MSGSRDIARPPDGTADEFRRCDPRAHLATLLQLGKLRAPKPLRHFFPRQMTRRLRARQLARGMGEVLSSALRRRPQVLLSGKGLRDYSGLVSVTSQAVVRKAVRAMARGQPVVMLSAAFDPPLSVLCSALGVDESDTVLFAVSGNPVTVFLANRGGSPVVVRVIEAQAAARLSEHRIGLKVARDALSGQPLLSLIPMELDLSISGDFAFLIESRLPGRPCDLGGTSDQEFERFVWSAMDPLMQLYRQAEARSGSPDRVYIDQNLAKLGLWWPRSAALLASSIEALRAWHRSHVRSVLVHGDYWLGNVLFGQEPSRVTGIIDWDGARADGCAGLDALHLVLMSFAERQNLSISVVLDHVWSGNPSHPFLSRSIDQVEKRFGLRHGDIEHLAALLWLSHLGRHTVRRSPQWEEAQVRRPAYAFLKWCQNALDAGKRPPNQLDE